MDEEHRTNRDDEPSPRTGSGDPIESGGGRGGMSTGAKAVIGILAAIAVVLLIVVIVVAVDDGGTDDPAQTTIEPDVTVEPPDVTVEPPAEAPSGSDSE